MTTTLTVVQSIPPTFSPQHDTSRTLERARAHINKVIVRQISTVLEKEPSVDLERVLSDALATYRRRLASATQTAHKRAHREFSYRLGMWRATTLDYRRDGVISARTAAS